MATEQLLSKLKEELLLMASLAERSLKESVKAIVDRDDKIAEKVQADDSEIDRLEVSIEEMVVTYIATHAPVAKDCRLMLVLTRICGNLERIGDESVTIARRAVELNAEPPLKPLIDIPRMASLAQEMLRDALQAFIREKPDEMQKLIQRDKIVDAINKQLARELTSYMIEKPATITRALNLMTVSKSIERIADHAKNIAEEVYYLHLGTDIRHQQLVSKTD
ncbi:MAG: phosphate signaling complex protein PhoU [Methylacidiphilales bacterium]|nr:phosphate signaling complex protein PhoU [Candidatus Methylacidiphilales bacterium]MDW8350135.1 phosphate signaling complex protein PhoU [Verrucomicrobiae bacterium]